MPFATPQPPQFNTAIIHPPYRKIRSDSPTRLLLRSAGIETSNLHAGFVAHVSRLLGKGDEMVANTSRGLLQRALLQTVSARVSGSDVAAAAACV